MDLKSKISQLRTESVNTVKGLKNLTFTDIWKNYQKFLKRLPDVSHLKNIVFFGGVATLLIFVLFAQRFMNLYVYLPKKAVVGGTYSEGLVGKIEQLNPLFSGTNSSEAAADKLIFSGLTKRNGSREIIPDLAKSWEVTPDGKTYTFHLKDNLLWHDGQPLTADDVTFTINTIQNPDTRSPLLEVWKGVEASKTDDKTVVFKLPNPYSPFLGGTDVPIVPKHILEMIPPRNLRIAEFGTKPVGSGPYELESLKKLKESEELTFTVNPNYYGKEPYIQKVLLKTYADYEKLSQGYARKEVIGMEKISYADAEKNNKFPNLKNYQLAIPEYDTLFFNLRNGLTKDKGIREALSLLIDRKEIIHSVYNDQALPIYQPILPGYLGYDSKIKQAVDLVTAKSKLTALGFVADKDGVLKNASGKLSLRLLSSDEKEESKEADIIEEQLEKAGVDVKVEKYPLAALIQDHIRPRDFDLILVSQNIGGDPDLYSFWHGSQVNDPGLNISGLSDRLLDKYIEQGRTIADTKSRDEKYILAEKELTGQAAAVFLTWPNYVWGVSKEVKGITSERLVSPEDRFWNIENWYIEEELI